MRVNLALDPKPVKLWDLGLSACHKDPCRGNAISLSVVLRKVLGLRDKDPENVNFCCINPRR